uniref:C-type lectin domain-containing protein n=1 Tax=Apteryx owenii TaxID=8824 RepID=A0A8B9S3Q0_APTOW
GCGRETQCLGSPLGPPPALHMACGTKEVTRGWCCAVGMLKCIVPRQGTGKPRRAGTLEPSTLAPHPVNPRLGERMNCFWTSQPGTTCELCPPGWQLHRGRCYYFSEEAVSWDDSQRNCLARKSQLLVVEDEIEMVSLSCIYQQILSSTEFKADHSLGSFCSLIRIVLNRIEADKNCAVYRRKNMIQTDNCQTLKKWICKKNATLLVL